MGAMKEIKDSGGQATNCRYCNKKVRYKKFGHEIVAISTNTVKVKCCSPSDDTCSRFITPLGRYIYGHINDSGIEAFIPHSCNQNKSNNSEQISF